MPFAGVFTNDAGGTAGRRRSQLPAGAGGRGARGQDVMGCRRDAGAPSCRLTRAREALAGTT